MTEPDVPHDTRRLRERVRNGRANLLARRNVVNRARTFLVRSVLVRGTEIDARATRERQSPVQEHPRGTARRLGEQLATGIVNTRHQGETVVAIARRGA